MIQDPKEINAIVESINKSVQLYSYDDISVEDLSNIIFNKLIASGISARIIQYSYGNKDLQSVQYYKQNRWVNFDYSGLDMLFQPIYNRTLNPQNIIKEELVDVQYATPEYPDESSSDDTDVTQEQVNTGVTNWISNHLSNFTSMVTAAVNNYLAAHTNDFKGDTGPAGPGFPSGTYRIKKQIGVQTVSNVSNVTFSDLNGDVDEEYFIEFDFNINTGGITRWILIQPNGDVGTNYDNIRAFYSRNGVGAGNSNNATMPLCDSASSSNCHSKGKATLYAISNSERLFKSDFMVRTGVIENDVYSGVWTNLSSNITSLVFSITGGSFSGTIKLYKIVDMAIS